MFAALSKRKELPPLAEGESAFTQGARPPAWWPFNDEAQERFMPPPQEGQPSFTVVTRSIPATGIEIPGDQDGQPVFLPLVLLEELAGQFREAGIPPVIVLDDQARMVLRRNCLALELSPYRMTGTGYLLQVLSQLDWTAYNSRFTCSTEEREDHA